MPQQGELLMGRTRRGLRSLPFSFGSLFRNFFKESNKDPRPPRRHHNPLRLEALEDRTLLNCDPIGGDTILSQPQRDAILQGLQGLAGWGETLSDIGSVAQKGSVH